MSIDIHISPSNNGVGIDQGIDALIKDKTIDRGYKTMFLGKNAYEIANSLKALDVENASHSSDMEFATESGWANDDDALILWDKAWDKYLTLLKSKDALEQFNEIQSTITSEVK